MTNSRNALAILRDVFGYPAFRGAQADIIQHVAGGGDALVLMPTGGGKSLCYQIPALLRSGCAIVVSTIHDDDENLFQALQTGSQGYLLKDHPIPWLKGLATLGPGDVVEDPHGQPLGPQLLDLSRVPQQQARVVASRGKGQNAALLVEDPIEQSGEPGRVLRTQAQEAPVEAPQDDPR